MKITKQRLQKIIKEEIAKFKSSIKEFGPQHVPEDPRGLDIQNEARAFELLSAFTSLLKPNERNARTMFLRQLAELSSKKGSLTET